jgi:hypothetical protein
VFNEPDNKVPQYPMCCWPNKVEMALQLLKKTFVWAREVNPSQPLSPVCGLEIGAIVNKLSPTERCQLEDLTSSRFTITVRWMPARKCVENLKRYNRPILCTEFMARPMKSTFDPVLGYFKEQNVGAYCWGFVSGKSQTIYPWDSWTKQYTSEPSPWFHDILRSNGTPYDANEVAYIKSLTREPKLRNSSGHQTHLSWREQPCESAQRP